jgi:hypothetical protein
MELVIDAERYLGIDGSPTLDLWLSQAYRCRSRHFLMNERHNPMFVLEG